MYRLSEEEIEEIKEKIVKYKKVIDPSKEIVQKQYLIPNQIYLVESFV